jgi:hypothetical protein
MLPVPLFVMAEPLVDRSKDTMSKRSTGAAIVVIVVVVVSVVGKRRRKEW